MLVLQAALLNLAHRPTRSQVLVLMDLVGFVVQTTMAWGGHSVSLRSHFILTPNQLLHLVGVWEECDGR